MVVEPEELQASLTSKVKTEARIEAHKRDGTPVLTGTASVGPSYGATKLEKRLSSLGDSPELFIVDQLRVGMRSDAERASVAHEGMNGNRYPFPSLRS